VIQEKGGTRHRRGGGAEREEIPRCRDLIAIGGIPTRNGRFRERFHAAEVSSLAGKMIEAGNIYSRKLGSEYLGTSKGGNRRRYLLTKGGKKPIKTNLEMDEKGGRGVRYKRDLISLTKGTKSV